MKDIQNLKDNRNVDIQRVGIKHLELPLIIQRKNSSNQVVCAKAKVSVSLPRDYKGTHMSRFVEVLTEWQHKNLLGVDIKGCLEKIINNLDAQSGELEFKFPYFIDKKSPVKGMVAPMSYHCSFEGRIVDEEYKFILGVEVPVTTVADNFLKSKPTMSQAHRVRTVMQNKYFSERGAYDIIDGKIHVNIDKVVPIAKEMLSEIIRIQIDGEFEKAEKYVLDNFVWTDNLELIAQKLQKISKTLNGRTESELAEKLLNE